MSGMNLPRSMRVRQCGHQYITSHSYRISRHQIRCSSSSLSSEKWGEAKNSNSPTTPLPKTIQRLRFLTDPKPSWGWRKEDTTIALTNSQLRKAAFTSQDAEKLLDLRAKLRESSTYVTMLSTERKKISNAIMIAMKEIEKLPTGEEKRKKEEVLKGIRAQANELKMQLRDASNLSDSINSEAQQIRLKMPNLTHPYTPIGSILNANLIGFGGNLDLIPEPMRNLLHQPDAVGQKLQDLTELEQGEPDAERDHLYLAQQNGWVDNSASNMVAGPSWPYMIGPLASLEVALTNYAIDVAMRHRFKPVVVPDVVKRDILGRAGFSPRESEAGQIYWIHADGSGSKNERDLALSGTAEITLGGLCAGNAYDSSSLPIQLVASSHAFRAEAGARGQDSRGLYRVHQFTKVEMFVVSRQTESEQWLERLRDVQEEIIGGLGIPYRILDMPTEELGASAYRKYDIEAWMPGRGSWGEISSASNCTEYQSRRLFIRYRPDKSDLFEPLSTLMPGMENGTPLEGYKEQNMFAQRTRMDAGEGFVWAHTLNATAVAVPRMILALLENYGMSATSDKLRLPITLKKYWTPSDVDSVEWFGKELSGSSPNSSNPNETSGKPSLFKRSLNRVRQMAERSGTDPASMVMSFLVLHELTAIVPLILLFYLFSLLGIGGSVMQWLLNASEVDNDQSVNLMTKMRSTLREYMQEGMLRAERYGRKKGWFGFEKGSQMGDVEIDGKTGKGELKAEILAGTFANAVAAYAITKALLPVRLAACVALAGPFARITVEPIKRLIRRRSVK